ncbi:MAG: hypothetical protein ACLPWF_17870 [Bryobacteraceae bacterium]
MKLATMLLGAALAIPACAQDPFEIHVYEYETLKPGQFTLEQHLNYWAIGSKESDGTLAPTNDQLHMTYELTGAITDHISLGVMQLNAVLPGQGFEYAGWRVLPHFYVPESWGWPVEAGLVVEFSFARPQFIADTAHVEVRPILQRRIKDFELVFNPVFARGLRGTEVSEGWTFEPAARVAYGDSEKQRFIPYLEWYSELGSVPDLASGSRQVHQLFPGVDIKLARHLTWSVAPGVGLTPVEPRLVFKSHLEFEFGRNDN